jgi:hypothetical protein
MPVTKPRIFVSYHHAGDQAYYNAFSGLMHDVYECVYDNSLQRPFDSEDVTYVRRRIRETHITGTSCTVVLCGLATPGRKYVDWEIAATLDKYHGLLGIKLPTLPILANGGTNKPARLQDNIDNGYASWVTWETIVADPAKFNLWIADACGRSGSLLNNSRPLRVANS